MGEVLILGGYGNFGKRIAEALARHGVDVTIAGRHREKAYAFAAQLRAAGAQVQACALDAERDLESYLQSAQPAVVINTCGPFQGKDYRIAEICIQQRVHYIDLADGRDFVAGISRLDDAAKAAGVAVICGASTVPALSSAVVEHYRHEFSSLEEMAFGISPGQKAERGLATTQGILTYVGRRMKQVPGDRKPRYGWQDIYCQRFPDIGYRWMANCDIPDLDLFPPRYGLKKIRFSAGLESTVLHLGLFALSWLVRLGLPLGLPAHAAFLLRASDWFNWLGTADGGMFVILRGAGSDGQTHERRWFVIAKNGDGPQIPCVPAILLAKDLAEAKVVPKGAYPCVGTVDLSRYLSELSRFSVKVFEQ